MKSVKRFEELWIWQQARILVKEIYSDFGPGTPGERDFGFRGQIQKAGVSIMNNIAEGFERGTDAVFASHLDIAKGSCGEVRSMYYSAEDLGYVSAETAEARRIRAKQISAGIASFIEHLRTNPIKKSKSQKEKESKRRKGEEAESQRVEESKSQRVEESKSRNVEESGGDENGEGSERI